MNQPPPAAALLCPGPSLLDFWSDDLFQDYDEVVAVNTAGHRFKCHWLAGVDRHIIKPILDKEKPAPLKGFLTHHTWGKQLVDQGYQYFLPSPYAGDCVRGDCRQRLGNDRCGYTMPNAVWWMRERYPKQEIHIFGFDCAVGKPCIGGVHGDRKFERFRKELIWLKTYWHPSFQVHSRIAPEIVEWLGDGDQRTDPPTNALT